MKEKKILIKTCLNCNADFVIKKPNQFLIRKFCGTSCHYEYKRTSKFRKNIKLQNHNLEYVKPCINPNKNINCKEYIVYKNKYAFLKSIKNNTLCLSCTGKASSIQGVATARKNGSYKIGYQTRIKNGTGKMSTKAKLNISIGGKNAYKTGKKKSWNKGLTKYTDSSVAKTGKSRPGKENPMFGTSYYKKWIEKYGEEIAFEMNKECSKKKLANGGKSFYNYNPKSIPIIEQYGKDNGYKFRHALNHLDGEFNFCGYYADGYDESSNTWLEFDEAYHFKNQQIIDRDIKRQKFIQHQLNCKFIRIKYNGEITIIERPIICNSLQEQHQIF